MEYEKLKLIKEGKLSNGMLMTIAEFQERYG
jgi:hypothetical protein